ncbi:hypothetical protein [Pseudoalteromonas sp. McH1-42]|uniref:hypothetical protein n=1 Tax=Pseudoalteromonas sp. McH1-42 TaxID=2917752 RepID=UPI001EF74D6C|nr:hypothetical protein [Pseudoalteromonas sp. McH1-42]MCG7561024.1 hypothetical protein [Pseudoalteromonas sp. McH1-42]
MDKYSEGCHFIRHYSTCSLNVRILTLVQGLVVLSAWGYLFCQSKFPPSILVAVASFGVLLTTFLFRLNAGYLSAADEFAKAVVILEGAEGGPATHYEKARESLYKNKWALFFTLNATFIFIGFTFFVCLVISVLMEMHT